MQAEALDNYNLVGIETALNQTQADRLGERFRVVSQVVESVVRTDLGARAIQVPERRFKSPLILR